VRASPYWVFWCPIFISHVSAVVGNHDLHVWEDYSNVLEHFWKSKPYVSFFQANLHGPSSETTEGDRGNG
jgi:hypothetical protein